MAKPRDNMAPNFAIEVAGHDVGANLARAIRSIEFESADGIADMVKIRLSNPNFVISESKIFQPGNELSVRMGYGKQLEYMGRVQIARAVGDFPENSMPTLDVVGYTLDHKMMDNAPETSWERIHVQPTNAYEIAEKVGGRYKIKSLDVDLWSPPKRAVVQKAGVSDYDLLKGLANISGHLFWVDADESGKWQIHFKSNKAIGTKQLQSKEYTFRYGLGEASTLLEFRPEHTVRGAKTQLKVAVRDPHFGEDYIEVVKAEDFVPLTRLYDWLSGGKATEDQKIEGKIPSGASVKLFFGDYALEVVPNKWFDDAQELRLWAEQWFLEQAKNFVIGTGKLHGVETLRARQVHTLDGLGVAYDGKYYFMRVRHMMSEGGGYRVDFTARKHLQL